MKRFLLASALFLFPAFFLKAEDDTQALLRQLDDALASASSYEGYFQQHLQALYGMLDGASSPSQRYELTCRLAEEYAYYSVDSTRACLNRNRQIAETLGDSTRLMHTDLLLVKLYAQLKQSLKNN